MKTSIFRLFLFIALFSSIGFGLSDDPNAISEEINKTGTYTVISKYNAFLSEVEQELKASSIERASEFDKQRTEWMKTNAEYAKSLAGLLASKNLIDAAKPGGKMRIQEIMNKITTLLTKAEDLKVSGQQILFKSSIDDAAKIEASEVYKNLLAVSPSDPKLVWNGAKTHVLALSYMNKGSYDQFWAPKVKNGELTLGDRNSWVSLVPELKEHLKAHAKSKSLLSINDRARQILGLTPEKNSVEKIFVEVWVKPNDLLRPCPDNEIDDKECVPDYYHKGEDVFTKVTTGLDTVVLTTGQKWKDWYLNERKDKYSGAWPFPWTRLGYTLDYRPTKAKIPVGVSEYITKGGTTIMIKGVYTPEEYVQ